MAKGKVGQTVESLGEYLREQRLQSRLSLRQLAEQAGVSNPYLSQIERGLRKPSADVLQQIAKALRISAEQLYIRAGIVSPEEVPGAPERSVELAILHDTHLNERQKQSLLDVYASFLALNTQPPPRRSEQAMAKFDIKTEATKPLYAGVGVTDLAVELVRDYVTVAQKRVSRPRPRRTSARSSSSRRRCATRPATRVDAISKDAKAAVPDREAVAAGLVDENLATVGDAYGDLINRGESLVTRIRKQESTKATVAVGQDHLGQGQDDQDPGHQGDEVDRQPPRRRAPRPRRRAPRQEQRQGHHHRGQEDRRLGHPGRRGRRRRRSATDRRVRRDPRDPQGPGASGRRRLGCSRCRTCSRSRERSCSSSAWCCWR